MTSGFLDLTVVNLRSSTYIKQSGDVYIGRGSPWGNPFRISSTLTREQVIILYKDYLKENPILISLLLAKNPKRLVCFCKPLACHGDVLKDEIQRH